ncbi:MAG: SipW-dependent-type signal peptide-containing protein, partial [Halorubrum sp.]
MTRDANGQGRPSGLSRRRLLAGIGGVGAVGMASGVGTGAYLADRETFTNNGFAAGSVELIVNDAVSDGTVAVDVSGIDRGDDGDETFVIEVQTNPARIWLATDCPDPEDDLARALEVDVLVDGESVADGYRSLADIRRDLVSGERLDADCLDPDDPVMVDVRWRLPGNAPDAVAGQETDLTFRLYAEQCRHVSETDAEQSNPFATRECDEPACVPCE